jgi:formylglycine-generating enzyme required for sulfatase activity
VRFPQFIAVTWLALMCALTPAHADKRVALVIGNSTYTNISPLRNPARDAQLIADTLRGLGFTLTGGGPQIDLDKAGFDRAVQNFGEQLQSADVALFYYAGHGIGLRGANYLVPIDANVTREADAELRMLNVNRVLEQMDDSPGGRLNLVILDACRNNPFESRLRSASRGLSVMQAPGGTLISFATQPGAVAQDGDSDHSPFTAALANSIRQPGRGLFEVFNEIGLSVKQATRGAQQPWTSSSPIAGQFYFAGPRETQGGGAAVSDADRAERTWGMIQNTTSLVAVDEYIRQYGHVPIYGALARTRREELAKQAPVPVQPQPQPGPQLAMADTPRRDGVPLTVAQERALKPKDIFRECENCPEMVVVPAGSFMMGSPADEKERRDNEGPQHVVTIGRAFAVGKLHVTVDQFAAFVSETKYAASSTCYKLAAGGTNGSWRDPGFAQEGSHPVVCLTWNDAKAYVDWIAKKTGKPYRLLSEAEFEYAARAGTTTPFWWGSSITPAQANYDGNYVYAGGGSKGVSSRGTVPAGSFQPNPWGLYNVHGNAWQWTEDCSHENYNGAPADGSAWTTGNCSPDRVVRGGSWAIGPRSLRAAQRGGFAVGSSGIGFRLARTLISAGSSGN